MMCRVENGCIIFFCYENMNTDEHEANNGTC